ncbi:non-specific lipid-transfer protein-like 1 isoform X1 [Phlebotomus argentipes]|uniref:non-specific lipid-transfer protein-like 1 isoform X1 n=1 Tax=Phlebotomus argentipes TaxID=94469 RepID=UPI002892C0AE|nr:non-specific lipid-transfer protein-like 1 isoform X1 [Phlebotomus argentipes]
MSFKSDEVFEKIKVRITKIDPANRQVEHVYKFNITKDGKVAKTWSKLSFFTVHKICFYPNFELSVLDLKNVKLFPGDSPDVECTLTMSDDDFYAMGTGSLPAKDALAQDKLDVDGDIELALKLSPFVSSL